MFTQPKKRGSCKKISLYDIKDAMNERNTEKLTQLLEEAKELINEGFGENEDTFLISAADEGNDESVEILLDKGALINLADKWGITALHIAAFQGHVGVVKQISDYIAKTEEIKDENGNVISPKDIINHQDHSGNTPLHVARSAEMFKLLLDMRVDPNIANTAGLSVGDIIYDPAPVNQRYEFDALGTWKGWYQQNSPDEKIPIELHANAASLCNGNEADQVEGDPKVAGGFELMDPSE